ncbi:MAG: DNA-3-methyladenine glycosylase [Anaerolineales bacterium]|nr:DNA-3-methyladenine glycosylase [Anaerolineales bacterium]MCX7755953.1 DNA-3-methyladenine glycosylase [Anaerolineales bacterium]MDW8279425.1 DNA-3-methyladenine glycosylase [Anaerolineales bacterium]
MPLPASFYARPTLIVARELLGCRLIRRLETGEQLTGIITETEAYIGEEDLACHARAGLTPRTRVMYGPPGRAYVYFTYGMHWLLNIVTEPEGFPAAVLIRALEVETGLEQVRANRPGIPTQRLTDGPAKLTRAFAIAGHHNNLDLTVIENGLWLEPGREIPDSRVTIGPRVGLYTVPEPWKSMPWRFRVQ